MTEARQCSDEREYFTRRRQIVIFRIVEDLRSYHQLYVWREGGDLPQNCFYHLIFLKNLRKFLSICPLYNFGRPNGVIYLDWSLSRKRLNRDLRYAWEGMKANSERIAQTNRERISMGLKRKECEDGCAGSSKESRACQWMRTEVHSSASNDRVFWTCSHPITEHARPIEFLGTHGDARLRIC